MARPRLLDLYCGEGGAGEGYARAGFDVTGVDVVDQPRYPYRFIRADAVEYLHEHGGDYDAVHASPPCQEFTSLRFRWGKTYPNLIEATRSELLALGLPYVIENVMQAPLGNPLVLCGSMFGLRVIRHRRFETAPPIWFPPGPCSHPRNAVGRRGHLGDREWMTVTGHFSDVKKAGSAMGIDWMSQRGLSQAIPPAYTEWIGQHILEVLKAA